MKQRRGLGLCVENDRLWLLDQTALPQDERWFAIDRVDDMIDAIHALKVRGAPMIAIAAALSIASCVRGGADRATIDADIDRLRIARPTAVNLAHAMDRLRAVLAAPDWRSALVSTADALADRNIEQCEAIADNGAALIASGEALLTHCNTGALATAGIGTAAGVIRRAHEQNKRITVWVDETRPLLQGARLTAWEFGALGIDYTLITDSMAAAFMVAGRVDRVVVGADRIAANGDIANKIGTYSLALAAFYHRIPFAVAAPATTLDTRCHSGADIPIEQRAASEVRGMAGVAGSLNWAPIDAPSANPAFDITPAKLVTHWILDSGVYRSNDIAAGVLYRLAGDQSA